MNEGTDEQNEWTDSVGSKADADADAVADAPAYKTLFHSIRK